MKSTAGPASFARRAVTKPQDEAGPDDTQVAAAGSATSTADGALPATDALPATTVAAGVAQPNGPGNNRSKDGRATQHRPAGSR